MHVNISKVIIIAIHEYQKLIGDKTNFFDFMQNSPLMGCELDIDS